MLIVPDSRGSFMQRNLLIFLHNGAFRSWPSGCLKKLILLLQYNMDNIKYTLFLSG